MNDNVQSPWPGPAGLIPVTSGRADDANVFSNDKKITWYFFLSLHETI